MIAIHNERNSFSLRWIAYCQQNQIPYKLVNCYDDDIIKQLEGCSIVLWHFSHVLYADVLFAKQLLFALEHAGVQVFPDFKTAWHFNDKIGQKYLLEALSAPLVRSYIFYSKAEALNWVKTCTLPKVFKLRSGAGSSNVRLIETRRKAIRYIHTSFGKGFSQSSARFDFVDKFKKYREGNEHFFGLIKSAGRLFVPTPFRRMASRERGYIYFQDYVPANTYDIRIIVIEGKAFGVNRFVRKHDFRASGSGKIEYLDESNCDLNCIKLAFELSEKLAAQCLAYDFIYDANRMPLILEVSYGFVSGSYDGCNGYWTRDLKWIAASFNPQSWILESLIEKNTRRQ